MKVNTTEKTSLRGELALIVAVIINSFGVVLMLYSGSGISAISSVPYAFIRSISMVNTWHLDIPFSRSSGFKPDDSSEKDLFRYICSVL